MNTTTILKQALSQLVSQNIIAIINWHLFNQTQSLTQSIPIHHLNKIKGPMRMAVNKNSDYILSSEAAICHSEWTRQFICVPVVATAENYINVPV